LCIIADNKEVEILIAGHQAEESRVKAENCSIEQQLKEQSVILDSQIKVSMHASSYVG
jgi:hypothetical protein